MRWTPERHDQLERAARDGRRVSLDRRGTEYIVTAVRLTQIAGREALIGRLPMTGEEMAFVLDDVEGFIVLGEV
ncbi:MAG: hypothetical protein E4H38_03715 [Gemmatimonadales bacterium]|nr:MAG: hypothetical protein E4H38_03715 [Gemmatimonadales bacterium]